MRKLQRRKFLKKKKRSQQLFGIVLPPRSLRKYKALTYLAGPMQNARGNGAGWRTRLGQILLDRFGIYPQDPVKTETTKTGLNATKSKQLLKKLMVLVIRYHDKEAEQKFMKIMNRIISSDLEMIARCNFLIAKIEENVMSGGTLTELIDAARMFYWQRRYMPKNKKKPVYVLYHGRPENFSAWPLYFILLSGGRVFLVSRNNGHKEFLDYMQTKYDFERAEKRANGKQGRS